MSQSSSNETPLATYSVKPSSLDKITDFLIRGDRRQAFHFALDERLWAHAMVIASSVDKDAWKEVVNEFVRSELGVAPDSASLSTGREPMRVAYNFFAGQGAASGKWQCDELKSGTYDLVQSKS
jgi:COPII coat assembly protein SEC16